jgi:hypothetical protein
MAHELIVERVAGHRPLEAGPKARQVAGGGLEAAKAAATAATAVVPEVAGVGRAAAVEAVPPLGVVEAVHGPASRPVRAAVSGSLPGAVACALSVAGWVLSRLGGAGQPGPLPAAVPVVVGVGLGLQEVQ